MKMIALSILASAALTGSAAAEPIADAAAYVIAAPTEQLTLPVNSMVLLQAIDPVNSGALRQGSKIALAVVNDVKIGDIVAIPAGARAEAAISWRTGRGLFGKSGKIEFDLVSIDVNGRTIAVSGHYRVEGHGAPAAAAATVLAVGWPGIFVTGHSAKVLPGAEFAAYTRESVTITAPRRSPIQQVAARTRVGTVSGQGGFVQANEGRKAGNDDAILVPM